MKMRYFFDNATKKLFCLWPNFEVLCEAFKNTHFLIECRTHIHSSIMKTQRQTTAVGKANLHRLLLLYNTERK